MNTKKIEESIQRFAAENYPELHVVTTVTDLPVDTISLDEELSQKTVPAVTIESNVALIYRAYVAESPFILDAWHFIESFKTRHDTPRLFETVDATHGILYQLDQSLREESMTNEPKDEVYSNAAVDLNILCQEVDQVLPQILNLTIFPENDEELFKRLHNLDYAVQDLSERIRLRSLRVYVPEQIETSVDYFLTENEWAVVDNELAGNMKKLWGHSNLLGWHVEQLNQGMIRRDTPSDEALYKLQATAKRIGELLPRAKDEADKILHKYKPDNGK